MRFEPAGLTNDADIRTAKSIVDYIFRWMGKKFLSPEIQEELGIMSPEVRAKLAAGYRAKAASGPDDAAPLEAAPPGQPLGGRSRVRQVRRPDGPNGLVLQVPRLRPEHRL